MLKDIKDAQPKNNKQERKRKQRSPRGAEILATTAL
jgi:hypothetical protein